MLWTPRPDARSTTRIGDFLTWLARTRDLEFADYDQLWRWSVDDVGAFWWAFAEWCGIRWHDGPAVALADPAMPGARWFPGGTLNYAEHALAAATDAARRRPRSLARSQTRGDRRAHVGRARRPGRSLPCGPACASAWGAATGSPRTCRTSPRPLVAFLATASLGAVWSSCAPEFGVPLGGRPLRARSSRWCCSRSTATATARRSSTGAPTSPRIEAALPTLRHTVHVPYLGQGRTTTGRALLAEAGRRSTFDPVPFDHPLYVLYSSGTTGLPKAIVHGHGGITVEHQKTIALHHDLGPGDRFFWFTTTGWMMWNYLMSGLLVGATVVLFDGDPGASPTSAALWRLAADTGVDVFGVGAPFLMACRKAGVRAAAAPLAQRRLHRRAAPARRVPLGPRRRRRRRAARVGERRHRRVRGVRGRGAAAAGARR